MSEISAFQVSALWLRELAQEACMDATLDLLTLFSLVSLSSRLDHRKSGALFDVAHL